MALATNTLHSLFYDTLFLLTLQINNLIFLGMHLHCVSKKHPRRFSCNSRKHCRIFI